MQYRLKLITIFLALLTCACAREALYALPIEEEELEEEDEELDDQ